MGSNRIKLAVAATMAIGFLGTRAAEAKSLVPATPLSIAPAPLQPHCLDCNGMTPSSPILQLPVLRLPVPVCSDCDGGWVLNHGPLVLQPWRPLIYLVPPKLHPVVTRPILPHPFDPGMARRVALDLPTHGFDPVGVIPTTVSMSGSPALTGSNIGRNDATTLVSVPVVTDTGSGSFGFHH